jgi:hypothetical protein
VAGFCEHSNESTVSRGSEEFHASSVSISFLGSLLTLNGSGECLSIICLSRENNMSAVFRVCSYVCVFALDL